MFQKSTRIFRLIPLAVLSIFASITGVKADTNDVYKVEGAYEVSIPANVTVDDSSNSGTLNVTGTVQPYHKLDVEVESANEYKLKCGSYEVKYKISEDEMSDGENGIKRFSYTADSAKNNFSKKITVNTSDTAKVSGEYTDTLTFTMNCEPTKKFELILHANGGTFGDSETSSKELAYGEVYGTLPTPKLENCTFNGWYKEKDFYGTTKVEADSTMEGENITIYAHWTGTWNVNIDPNGGTLYVMDGSIVKGASETNPIQCDNPQFQVRYDDGAYNNLLIRAKKEGYECTGYFDASTGGTQVWEASGPCTKTEKYYKFLGGERGAVWVNKDITQGKTFTFYPQWKANTYTIEYNSNASDTTETMNPSSHTYDVEASLTPNVFSRTGYTFLGWAEDQDATQPVYSDNQSVKNLTSENGATVTLYAVWQKNSSTSEHVNDIESQNNQEESAASIQDDFVSDESDPGDAASEQFTDSSSEVLEMQPVESTEPEQLITEEDIPKATACE